jgi:hypothetical protein
LGQIQVTGASIVSGGSGGTNGTRTVTVKGGTVGAGGSPAQLSVTVSGGAITAVLGVVNAGSYVQLPNNPMAVTDASLAGATLALTTNVFGGEPDFLL